MMRRWAYVLLSVCHMMMAMDESDKHIVQTWKESGLFDSDSEDDLFNPEKFFYPEHFCKELQEQEERARIKKDAEKIFAQQVSLAADGQKCDINLMQKAIADGAEPCCCDANYTTALMHAARGGCAPLVDFLLSAEREENRAVYIDLYDKDGWTALDFALSYPNTMSKTKQDEYKKVVDYLLAHMDTSEKSTKKFEPYFQRAMVCKNESMVEHMIEKGVPFDAQELMRWAACYQCPNVIGYGKLKQYFNATTDYMQLLRSAIFTDLQEARIVGYDGALRKKTIEQLFTLQGLNPAQLNRLFLEVCAYQFSNLSNNNKIFEFGVDTFAHLVTEFEKNDASIHDVDDNGYTVLSHLIPKISCDKDGLERKYAHFCRQFLINPALIAVPSGHDSRQKEDRTILLNHLDQYPLGQNELHALVLTQHTKRERLFGTDQITTLMLIAKFRPQYLAHVPAHIYQMMNAMRLPSQFEQTKNQLAALCTMDERNNYANTIAKQWAAAVSEIVNVRGLRDLKKNYKQKDNAAYIAAVLLADLPPVQDDGDVQTKKKCVIQ